MLANLINGADVCMIQGGCCARFASKTFESLLITGQIVRQELQRHKTAKLSVLGLVNHAHAATPKLLENGVARNCFSGERLRIRHVRVILSYFAPPSNNRRPCACAAPPASAECTSLPL